MVIAVENADKFRWADRFLSSSHGLECFLGLKLDRTGADLGQR